jgi:hypothetical protein
MTPFRRPGIAVVSALSSSLADRVPSGVRAAAMATGTFTIVLASLSSLGALSPRITPAPMAPPAPSPWTVAHAHAIDDGACQLALRVLDGPHGVADAAVQVSRLGEGGVVVERYNARTDSDGCHRLIDLPHGFYDVTVDVDGKALAGAPTFSCNAPGQRASFSIALVDAQHQIDGVVRGKQNKPLVGATVALWQNDNARLGVAGVVRVRTNDDGHFSAPVAPGTYLAWITADDHVAKQATIAVGEAPVTSTTLKLAYSPSVRGVVVDETGAPLVDAVVAIGGAYDPRARTTTVTTDATGHFALPVHEGQDLTITARGHGRVARAVLGVVDDVAALQRLQLVATTGRVVHGVVLTADGGVLAYGAVEYRVRASGLSGEAPTDAQGRFVLDGMPVDQDVEVWAKGNASGAWGAQVSEPTNPQRLALLWVQPAW